MSGQLIYVVGPSGSGKDSIIQALSEHKQVTVMRRVITRQGDSIGEVADAVDANTFEQMKADGQFSMSWQANGLSYGIPLSMDTYLQAGHVVVVNGSRKYCETLSQQYPNALVVLVTVKTELLRKRLEQRNRESSLEIEQRLQRNALFEQNLLNNFEQWNLRYFMLDNSAELMQTVEQFQQKLSDYLGGMRKTA